MRAKLLVTTAALVAIVTQGAAQADDWAGYYIGIDGLDGSRDHISIAPADDGSYDIRVKSSGFGACADAHPSAVATAVGQVVGGDLVAKDGRLRCDESNEIAIRDSTFALDADLGVISFEPHTGGRVISLHRVSDDSPRADPWAGYYMGIDAADGSLDGTSIVANGDGTYAIRVHSTKFASCPTGHPAAHIAAVGKVVDDRLVREQTAIRCDDSEDVAPMSDVSYTRDPQTGILTLELPEYDRTQTYHRLSGG